jgi:hypothetical protein
MTCGRCNEVHTNDNLLLTMNPADGMRIVERTCVFCEYGLETATPNGTMGRRPGVPARVTREEDRLEAEEWISRIL